MAQELKAYNVVATADVNPDVVDSLGCTEFAGYDADEVDAVLAEKDKDISYWRKEYDEETKLTDALKAEIESLKASHYAEIARLKEERRWRKYPEEKPSEDTRYIICGSSGFRDADRWTYIPEKQRMGFGFHDYGVKYWMPMPSAPKEADK